MAEDLQYDPRPTSLPGAREDLDALIETLHRTGTLRLINDLVARFGDFTEVSLEQMASPTGRNIIGTLLLLGNALGKVDATKLTPLIEGLEQGMAQAEKAMQRKPPNTLHVLSLLRDEDTRRAFGAMLEIAKAVGAQLPKIPAEPSRQQ